MRVVGTTDGSMGRFVHVATRHPALHPELTDARILALAHHTTFREEDMVLVKKAAEAAHV